MTTYCTHCGTRLISGACTRCPQPSTRTTALPSATIPRPTLDWVTATGRLKMAGLFVGAGGVGLALSSFLPWVSALGIAQARPSMGDVFVLLLVGAGTAFLGTRLLQNKPARAVRVILWVLSVIEALVVLAFYEAFHALNQATLGGVISVSGVVKPALGFYMAVLALLSTIVGTIMMQTAKSSSPRGSSGEVFVGAPTPAPTPVPQVQPQTPLHLAQPLRQVSGSEDSVWWDGHRMRDLNDA
jgi:hypothetical protein